MNTPSWRKVLKEGGFLAASFPTMAITSCKGLAGRTTRYSPPLRLHPCALAFAFALASLGSVAVAIEQTHTTAAAHLVSRDFKIAHRYLNIPINRGAPKQKVALLVDGTPIVVNDIEVAGSAPDWWAFIDLKDWQGRTATVQIIGPEARSQLLEQIEVSDAFRGQDELYQEPLRPLIHFSSRRGWMNDPNGLVYYDGEYHLFYQHNPYGWTGGNVHWGHATSSDMVHWKELGEALRPDQLGHMFSGSAVVDWENTSGFGRDGKPPLVLVYTAAGSLFTQCIAYSTDGLNFSKFAGNPVIREVTPLNRDPRVFWHAPTKRWVMVLYTEATAGKGILDAAGEPAMVSLGQFFTSPNLREWTPAGTIAGGMGPADRFLWECLDMFELPVNGDASRKKWVIAGGNGEYAVGKFDGERFVPETPKLRGIFGNFLDGERFGAFYAAQTFNDVPDGRRIQIAWGVAPSPGMAFNQLQLLPSELSLVQTSGGPRLARTPAGELTKLRDGPDQSEKLEQFRAEAIEFCVEIEASDIGVFEADVRGAKISYDARTQELSVNGTRARAPWVNERQNMIIYMDRTVIEVFASDGLTYVAEPFVPNASNRSVSVQNPTEALKVRSLRVYRLKSIWSATQ